MLFVFLTAVPLAGVIYTALRLRRRDLPPDFVRSGPWVYSHYLAMNVVFVLLIAAFGVGFLVSVWDATSERTAEENVRVVLSLAVGLGGGITALRLLEPRPLLAVALFVLSMWVATRFT